MAKPSRALIYSNPDAIATMIFLHGSSPADLALGRQEAKFFVEHGFRVLLPDYLSVTTSAEGTAANYRRWAQVAEDIVVRSALARPFHEGKLRLPGRPSGPRSPWLPLPTRSASTLSLNGLACFPTNSFPRCQSLPPLLILHGDQDKQVPIVNARQLIRLCELKGLHLCSWNLSRRGPGL